MTAQGLVIWPDHKLSRVCDEVTEFDAKLIQLVVNLHATMKKFDGHGSLPDAAGLAAPQIGILKRVFVYKLDGEQTCMINPKIIEGEGKVVDNEGCLSFPGVYIRRERREKILVEFQDVDGNVSRIKTEGFTARCIQHELDHVNGITFIDHLSRMRKDILTRKMRKAKKRVQATQKRLNGLSEGSFFTRD